ncbi:PAS domain-containing protein [Paractinoplanes rhizophilus]|uniref:PAS domain-containing protein n=1 Tax=Paractinoplanes rhizophilus TaxID=1416877 RepID=A0ABW2HV34_9ACTN|nr:PAS domain-containing protein [Actinoplanes sp.]
MAHVELSLSGAFVPQARTPAEAEFMTGLDRWTSAVAEAAEPCLVIDTATTILAVSASCCELFGLGKPAEVIGQPLGSALRLIDFTAGAGELDETDVEKIPPLLAIRSERLARGLLRTMPAPGEPPLTVDAITTPLLLGERVAGSLTFFASVR